VYDWNWAEAERLFRQAIAVNQNYPTAYHWLALNVLVPLRRFQEADDELRHALERDPLSRAVTTSIGMAAYYGDRYTDAIDGFARTLELDDAFPLAHAFLAQACTELGRHDDAVAAAEAAMRLSGANPEIHAPRRTCTDAPVTHRRARTLLDGLVALAQSRYVSASLLAQAGVAVCEVNDDARPAGAGLRAALSGSCLDRRPPCLQHAAIGAAVPRAL
jgi:tetratricopeptide (TPR) repeat protein